MNLIKDDAFMLWVIILTVSLMLLCLVAVFYYGGSSGEDTETIPDNVDQAVDRAKDTVIRLEQERINKYISIITKKLIERLNKMENRIDELERHSIKSTKKKVDYGIP